MPLKKSSPYDYKFFNKSIFNFVETKLQKLVNY